MHCRKILSAAGLLLGVTTFNAYASLTSYTGTGGAGLVYSSVSNITWTSDANLLGTLEASNVNLVNTIISTIDSITDTPNFWDTPAYTGTHTLSAGDFGANGLVSWFGAQAFVGYLNNITYGGSKQWRLPTSNGILGYNGTAGNELGQLFYSELDEAANAENVPSVR